MNIYAAIESQITLSSLSVTSEGMVGGIYSHAEGGH